MKPNNLTSLRRMSRVRLACHGFLTILQSELNILQGPPFLHPFLLCHSSTGLWAKPCRAAPTSLKYDFKDACERLDNVFIDTTTLK